MQTKARFLGHPIHQMLIVFPLGLLATSLVFDVIHGATGNGKWSDVAFYLISAGIVGGLGAAVFGLIDWIGIPSSTRAKRIGALHGISNVVVVALFTASWMLRRDDTFTPPAMAYGLAAIAGGIAMFSGWLGGELVDRMGVGVHEDAHLDAPSSMNNTPIGTTGRYDRR